MEFLEHDVMYYFIWEGTLGMGMEHFAFAAAAGLLGQTVAFFHFLLLPPCHHVSLLPLLSLFSKTTF